MERALSKAKTFIYLYHSELRTLSVIGLVFVLGVADGFAQTGGTTDASDPWSSITTTIITWITGSLGKLIALVGIIISVIASLITHSFKPLVYGVILSVVVGGMVGIAKTFFEAGSTAFGTNW